MSKRRLHPSRTLVSRRTALKTVIVGAVSAGGVACTEKSDSGPSVGRANASATSLSGACPILHGESFSNAHSKRDGNVFPRSAVKETCDIVIVGGGASGLCALHALQGRDVVLLEKEDHLGGNCSSDSWQGVAFSTGAAFFTQGDTALVELMRAVGAPGQPIVGGDALVVRGEAFHDFMGDGARKLPFAPAVRDAFRRSADEARKARRARSSRALDAESFSEFLRPYPAELRAFWDRFGASNWGASSEHTSARLGLSAYNWLSGEEARLSYAGGLGVGVRALASYLEARLPGQLRTSTFTHHIEVESEGESVLVHALQRGVPHAIRARRVIVAVPKFFAARMLPHMGAEQRSAMTAFRYAPYLVFNVCLNAVGPQPAYDNWFLDAPFADFIPADWVLHAGRGPEPRKTVLTVYHPLAEARRSELLDDEHLVHLADEVVLHLTRHFPGLRANVAETRVFRRGHALPLPTPGQLERAGVASRARGPIVFAHSDSRGDVSSLPGAQRAALEAVAALA